MDKRNKLGNKAAAAVATTTAATTTTTTTISHLLSAFVEMTSKCRASVLSACHRKHKSYVYRGKRKGLRLKEEKLQTAIRGECFFIQNITHGLNIDVKRNGRRTVGKTMVYVCWGNPRTVAFNFHSLNF